MRCPFCGGDPDLPVLRRWEAFIPVETPSQNVGGTNKGRWAAIKAYAGLRDRCMEHLLAWKGRDRIPPAQGKRRVTLIRCWVSGGRHRGKERDRINNAGGMKPLLDALVSVRLLTNDTESAVEDHYGQRRVDYRPGVMIVLEDIQWPSEGESKAASGEG